MSEGNSVFALEDGGTNLENIFAECWTSATAAQTYNNNGPSTGCNSVGSGGPWLISVYKIGNLALKLQLSINDRILVIIAI